MFDNFFIQLLLSAPLFIVLLIAAYRNFFSGEVPNSLIGAGFAWQLILFIPLSFASHGLNYLFFLFLAWIIGYFLWYGGLWSAGDAKLFAAGSPSLFLIQKNPDPIIIIVEALFFTFIAFFSYSFLHISIFMFQKTYSASKFSYENPRRVFLGVQGWMEKNKTMLSRTHVFVVIFFIFLRYIKYVFINQKFLVALSPQTKLLLMFGLFYFLQKVADKKYASWIVLFLFAGYLYAEYLFGEALFAADIFLHVFLAVIFAVIFIIVKKMVRMYVEEREVVTVPLSDLQRGVVLAESEITDALKNKNFQAKDILKRPNQARLASADTQRLIRAYRDCGQTTVRVVQKHSFAAFICAGIVLAALWIS